MRRAMLAAAKTVLEAAVIGHAVAAAAIAGFAVAAVAGLVGGDDAREVSRFAEWLYYHYLAGGVGSFVVITAIELADPSGE